MRAIEKRIARLEPKRQQGWIPFQQRTLDGTRAEVEAQQAALPKGRHILRVLVPHVGETTNDFRRSIGLVSLEIPGWDEPRQRGTG
jgi:hypothetical protein